MTKYMKRIRSLFGKPEKPAFSFAELLALGVNESYAKQIIHRLLQRQEIIRIRKAWYTYHRDPTVFAFTLPPRTAYFGLGFAAHMHGCWEQSPNPELLTYLAPRKVRSSTYSFADHKVIVRRISKVLFFGYEYMDWGGWRIPVSTYEKTLIDILHYRYPFTSEIVPQLLERINKEKTAIMLQELPPRIGTKLITRLDGLGLKLGRSQLGKQPQHEDNRSVNIGKD